MFEEIGKVSCSLQTIGLRESNIGKKMGQYLQKLDLKNLEYILITSEPIGNKSIKDLMKMDLPLLRKLVLQNTDLTTDFIRTLTKLSHSLVDFKFIGYSNTITTIILKQIINISPPEYFLISLTPFYLSADSYYVNWLVKSSSRLNYFRPAT